MRYARPIPEELAETATSLLLALGLCYVALVCRTAKAECSTNHPLPGVTCCTDTRQDPPMRLFIAEVELTNPRVHVRVAPGGPDPDGPGRWQTTLMQPTRIAAREGLDLVVNGDFFYARGIKDAEGTNSTFHSAIWAAVTGPAVTDGKAWSTRTNASPCLVVHKDGKVTIEKLARPGPDAWEVVAGNTMLIEDGAPVPHKSKVRQPRTVVGLGAKGAMLVIMVVDGRKPGTAVGMSYEELALLSQLRLIFCVNP